MKRIILAMICLTILGLIGCGLNNSKSYAQYKRFDGDFTSGVYVNVIKDSKGRPHKIAVFSKTRGVAAVDLDINTYK